MISSLSIGLVGCGHWGRHILRDLCSLGADVHVATRRAESTENARAGGAATIVQTHEQLPAADGIVIATPTPTHAEVIRGVASRGVPIFCEKPLCPDAAEAARLAAELDGRLFVMDKWRYHPGIEELARIARSGELGPATALRMTRCQWGNPHPGLDLLWHLAPHDVSIALEILGTIPDPRMAVAEQAQGEPTGLIAILGDHPVVVLEISGRHLPHRRETRLQCEGGVAWLADSYSKDVQLVRSVGPLGARPAVPEARPVSDELPLRRELRAFTDYLRGGPPPKSSAQDAARNVAVVSRMRELAGLSPA